MRGRRLARQRVEAVVDLIRIEQDAASSSGSPSVSTRVGQSSWKRGAGR